MREALATADHELVRREPRARSSSRAATRSAPKWWQRRGRGKAAKPYLALAGGGLLAAVIVGTLVNALWLQKMRHPAPILGGAAPSATAKPSPAVTGGAVRSPRPESARPVATSATSQAPERPAPEPAAAAKPRQIVSVEPAEPKPADPIGQLLKGTGREPPAREPRPAAAVPQRPAPSPKRPASSAERPAASPGTRQSPPTKTTSSVPARKDQAAAAQPSSSVAAAQRALVKLGFVLKPDGVAGATTRSAIERYEREHGLPVRGKLTPALMQRLGAEAGIAIE